MYFALNGMNTPNSSEHNSVVSGMLFCHTVNKILQPDSV